MTYHESSSSGDTRKPDDDVGQKWVRLDVGFARNPKVLELVSEGPAGYRAALVYVCSLGYCGEQGSDGYIPRHALIHIHGRPKDADLLVTHRLWQANGTGWHIRDWAEFQPTSEEERARGRSARKAACVRWHGDNCGCWETDA